MKYIGLILLAVLAVIVLLLLIAVLRTLLMPSKTSTYVADEPEEEALALAQKLSKMIQYDTTSYANVAEVEKFLGFHKVLEELFPLVHEKLEKTEIDGNLLFYWKGKSSEKPKSVCQELFSFFSSRFSVRPPRLLATALIEYQIPEHLSNTFLRKFTGNFQKFSERFLKF
jgi:hypothetical protein